MEEGSGGRLVASAGRGGDGREQQELRRVPVGGELRRGGGCVPTRGGAGLWGKWGEEVEGSIYRGSGCSEKEGARRSGRWRFLSPWLWKFPVHVRKEIEKEEDPVGPVFGKVLMGHRLFPFKHDFFPFSKLGN